MKNNVLFIHDHKFIRDEKLNYYSEGKITDEVLHRYLALGSSIEIISRVKHSPNINSGKLTKIEANYVNFEPVIGIAFSSIFGKHLISNIVKLFNAILRCRVAILRVPCFLSIIAFPIIIIVRKKYFVEVVGFPRDASKGRGEGVVVALIGYFMHNFTRQIIFRANGAIYVSKSALQRVFPTMGITAAASNVELAISPVDSKLSGYMIRRVRPKIGLIGSYSVNYKGIDIAIRVLSLLKRDGLECDLHVLGDGDRLKYIRLSCDLGFEPNLHFDGIVAGGASVLAWLDDIDIYIQPSRTEGMPRSLIEAMSRGLPAVASNVGSIPELLPSEYIFDPEDLHSFYTLLRNFILSVELRSDAGIRNAAAAKMYDKHVLEEIRKGFWNAANDIT